MQLDLVPVADQETVNGYDDVRNMCVLPDMGADADDTPIDPFQIGFNDPDHVAKVTKAYDAAIDHAAEQGIPYVIVFTGMNCERLSFNEQVTNLVAGFSTAAAHAQEKDVTLILEMLNTRIAAPMKGHPGYLGDNTDLTARIVREVDSPSLGLVFDFYHMHIMGEDLTAMIEKHGDLVRYVHLAGAYPVSDDAEAIQRAELHLEGQQIDFKAVMAGLKKIGYDGPIAFEYVPTTTNPDEATANLRSALEICEVGN
jgi:hydroxypyruvate isomerase